MKDIVSLKPPVKDIVPLKPSMKGCCHERRCPFITPKIETPIPLKPQIK